MTSRRGLRMSRGYEFLRRQFEKLCISCLYERFQSPKEALVVFKNRILPVPKNKCNNCFEMQNCIKYFKKQLSTVLFQLYLQNLKDNQPSYCSKANIALNLSKNKYSDYYS